MYYFAYGSDLSQKEMRERCPDSKPKFPATLPNFKLIFTGYSRKWHGGVASIKLSREGKVIGAVYEISERDLKLLDKYEGYPIFCDRLKVIVMTRDREAVEAITYVKREKTEETQLSQEYIEVMRQGYKDWRII